MRKKELKNLRNHRLIGRMVRIRAKWAYEGEKPTIFLIQKINIIKIKQSETYKRGGEFERNFKPNRNFE